ncbi:MAG: metal ABC transporter permease [Pseudomonadota bacterium]
MLWQALTFQLGYNAALVTVGATLLGLAAGTTGTFLFLRKRSLVSDAIAHATFPGVGLAFLLMVALGGDGRSLGGLLMGAAISAGLGLLAVQWLAQRTRLGEDTAIGAVLSVFFGLGVVLLTVIQSMATGRQAGLDSLLLGATAGMLWSDALLIAVGGALSVAATYLLRRPLTIAAFDPGYAQAQGMNTARIDVATMALVLAITVIGLKIVGLILIVALLIIPPVAARMWTEQSDRVVGLAGLFGGAAGYIGAALSASAPDLPTGPLIVLVSFGLFVLSFLLAPGRGLLSVWLRHRRFQAQVHLRQGLLALASGQPIFEPYTLRLLMREDLARADGVATDNGRARAARALLDETRWSALRATPGLAGLATRYDGLTPIEDVLTPDQIVEIDAGLGPKAGVSA